MTAIEKAQKITKYVGKTITDLCHASLANLPEQSHCAHFVDHALELTGIIKTYTCKNFTSADKKVDGHEATIRVDDIFNALIESGDWSKVERWPGPYLIFVTLNSNMKKTGLKNVMGNALRKHIGVFHAGQVVHYSNGQDVVVKQSLDEFKKTFSRAYGGKDIVFYFGVIR